VARVTIEQITSASHRQMFGVLFWFVLLVPLGPAGAVLFRAPRFWRALDRDQDASARTRSGPSCHQLAAARLTR